MYGFGILCGIQLNGWKWLCANFSNKTTKLQMVNHWMDIRYTKPLCRLWKTLQNQNWAKKNEAIECKQQNRYSIPWNNCSIFFETGDNFFFSNFEMLNRLKSPLEGISRRKKWNEKRWKQSENSNCYSFSAHTKKESKVVTWIWSKRAEHSNANEWTRQSIIGKRSREFTF